MLPRRKFLAQLTHASALACLPLPTLRLFAEYPPQTDALIKAVEVLRVSGKITRIPDLNRQYQAQPLHIYPNQRPEPYTDSSNRVETTGEITHHYIRIITDGGIEGLYGYIDPETVTPILKQLGPFLIGKNALSVEMLWDQLYRLNRHSRAGHYMMALSAVDNALWDIRGRYFKQPVYQMLGGATRTEARVYGSCLGFSIEKGKAGLKAKSLFNQGFLHQKWFLAYGPGSGNEGLRRNIELVEELRDALGFEADIMFDAFMGWDLPYAQKWAQEVETYRPFWIEEAFPPNRLDSFVQLSQSTTIPVATGEHFYNRWEVVNFLEQNAIQIVQADPEWCGGVSELVKICHLASSFGAKVIPHGHNIHSALHVVLSQSPAVCPLVEYLINSVPGKQHFQKNPILTDNGIIPLPQRPGFGIELDQEKVEQMDILT